MNTYTTFVYIYTYMREGVYICICGRVIPGGGHKAGWLIYRYIYTMYTKDMDITFGTKNIILNLQ